MFSSTPLEGCLPSARSTVAAATGSEMTTVFIPLFTDIEVYMCVGVLYASVCVCVCVCSRSKKPKPNQRL